MKSKTFYLCKICNKHILTSWGYCNANNSSNSDCIKAHKSKSKCYLCLIKYLKKTVILLRCWCLRICVYIQARSFQVPFTILERKR